MMDRLRQCYEWFYEWIRPLRELKWKDVKTSLFNGLTIGNHIPSIIYKTDLRLMFVATAVYASLVTQFQQVANQEATGDIGSGRNFKINSEFTNHSIAGGLSDRILWNCRDDSRTKFYYRTLYLGLILSYFSIITIYFVARVVVTGFVANAAWTLIRYDDRNKMNKIHHLESMANGFQMINALRRDIRRKKDYALRYKQSLEDFRMETEALVAKWNKKWNQLVRGYKDKKFLYNWLTILYIIPRCETLLMLAIITFALTSYDIYPLGCLSHIDVLYNETEMSVTLKVSENIIRYQQASVILIGLLLIIWVIVKIIQYLLLPRRWGLLITKCFSLNLQRIWPCLIHLLKECGCSCKEAKCCSVNCSCPCGKHGNHIYDDDSDDD